MNKSKFFALGLCASLLLVGCKGPEITKEEAAKTLTNISKKIEAVESVSAMTMESKVSESVTVNDKNETHTAEHYFAISLENKIMESYVKADDKLVASAVAFYEGDTFYTVNRLKESYIQVKYTPAEVETNLNKESLEPLFEGAEKYAETISAYLELTVNSFTKALDQLAGTKGELNSENFNVKFYSANEGNLVSEVNIKYSYSASILEQKFAQEGKTVSSVEFDNYMPSKLITTSSSKTSVTIAGKTVDTTTESEESMTFNYNARIKKPSLDDFKLVK